MSTGSFGSFAGTHTCKGAPKSRRKEFFSDGLTTSDNVCGRRKKTDHLSHCVPALRAQHRQLEPDLTTMSSCLLPSRLPVVLVPLGWLA